jgi:hypothetical protein
MLLLLVATMDLNVRLLEHLESVRKRKTENSFRTARTINDEISAVINSLEHMGMFRGIYIFIAWD